jgi:hypothetical protein
MNESESEENKSPSENLGGERGGVTGMGAVGTVGDGTSVEDSFTGVL